MMNQPFVFIKTGLVLGFLIFYSCKSGELRGGNVHGEGGNSINTESARILENNFQVSDKIYEATLAKEKLGVGDLYILALKHSEKMAIGAENVLQARQKTRQAWAAVLPSVSFRMSLYAPDTTGLTGGVFSRGFRFYARQNLLTGLDEVSGLRGGRLREDFDTFQLRAEAALLYDQIAQVFFEYLVLEDNLNTQKILIENSEDLKRELERRFNLGKVRRSELLSVEVVIAKTEAVIINLHNQLANARRKIRDLTGLSSQNKAFVPEKPIDEDFKNDFKLDEKFTSNTNVVQDSLPPELLLKIENRPDIASLKASWELAKLESFRASGGHLPKIYLEGSYRLPDAGSTGNDYYGALVAEIPLFSGGLVHSQYLERKSRERQARLAWDEAVRLAKDELSYYIHAWRTGEKALEMLRLAMEKTQYNYKTILSDYRIGQATNLEALSALNESAAAKEEFEKTRLNQMLTILHIKILTGELP